VNEDYRKALDTATRELESLTAQRADLDRRIGQLLQTVGNLMRLCNLTPTVPLGLTDGCRMVLRAAASPLTAVEVRAQLAAMGIDLSRYENDLAAIHTTLKRLNQSGEVRFIPQPWGKPAYQCAQAPRVFAASNRAEVDALIEKKVLPGEPSLQRRKRKKRGDA
jgi:hypothetical protein